MIKNDYSLHVGCEVTVIKKSRQSLSYSSIGQLVSLSSINNFDM